MLSRRLKLCPQSPRLKGSSQWAYDQNVKRVRESAGINRLGIRNERVLCYSDLGFGIGQHMDTLGCLGIK